MASYQTVKTGKEHCLSYHMFDFFFFFICYQNIFFFFFKLPVFFLFFFLTEFGPFSVVSIMLYVQERVSGHRFVRTKKKERLTAVGPTEAGREQTFWRDCCTDLRVSGCVRLEDMFFS